jgi:hypothetical protein
MIRWKSREQMTESQVRLCDQKGASMQRDIDLIIERLNTEIPGVQIEQLKVKYPEADDDGLWFIVVPGQEKYVQVESSSYNCPFLIESTFNDERFEGCNVSEVVQKVKDFFGLK